MPGATLPTTRPLHVSGMGRPDESRKFIKFGKNLHFVPYSKINVSSHKKITISIVLSLCGSGSSVGIATDYGLDGPGSNPGGDEIFRPSRPALGPT